MTDRNDGIPGWRPPDSGRMVDQRRTPARLGGRSWRGRRPSRSCISSQRCSGFHRSEAGSALQVSCSGTGSAAAGEGSRAGGSGSCSSSSCRPSRSSRSDSGRACTRWPSTAESARLAVTPERARLGRDAPASRDPRQHARPRDRGHRRAVARDRLGDAPRRSSGSARSCPAASTGRASTSRRPTTRGSASAGTRATSRSNRSRRSATPRACRSIAWSSTPSRHGSAR